MNVIRVSKLAAALFVAALVIALPALADEIKGKIKSIDRAKSEIVVADEKTESDVTVSLSGLGKGVTKGENLRKLRKERGSRSKTR
jgi:ABC-type molybdate transport system permease subunit